MSLSIDDLAWSGTPISPFQNQPTFDNADYSTQYAIPDTANFTPFTLENPTDNSPALGDNFYFELNNIFHADQGMTLPAMQFDDLGDMLPANTFGASIASFGLAASNYKSGG